MTYIARGKIVPFIEAAQAEPTRVWTCAEAARLIGLKSNKLGGSLIYAIRGGIIHRGKRGGQIVYSATPLPDIALPPPKVQTYRDRHPERFVPGKAWATDTDDVRVPKVVPGWKPPQMVCVRDVGP